MSNDNISSWDEIILEAALNILAILEKRCIINPKFSLADVKAKLPMNGHPTDAYIQMILDDEFSKRYDGKQVVYFMKIKD